MLRNLKIDFTRRLRDWDGFGINYVETSQTRDYETDPQDYGGFSILSDEARAEIVELVFGDDGLQPGLVKMFLDPFHQGEPDARYRMGDPMIQPDAYDHEGTTKWMRQFVEEGHRLTRERGDDFSILATLYGPPGWMTRQGYCRGRDLRSDCEVELAKYLAAWAHFLREERGLPLDFVSLHNEGEDWMRWPEDGAGAGEKSHDYNLFWPLDQLVRLIPLVRDVLDANGLQAVGVTPGETSNWVRFHHWGYADALANDPAARDALGLITSHGFWSSYAGQWNGDHRSTGIDAVREHRPDLHAWNTSSNWGKEFLYAAFEASQSVYAAKLNGIIPWAAVQRHALWSGGDPNPQTAFIVREDGTFEVTREYFIYKHLCRSGRRGSAVVPAFVNDTEIYPLAFGNNGAAAVDAFVLANLGRQPKELSAELAGGADSYFVCRTTRDECWIELDEWTPGDPLDLPAESITSFIGVGV